MQRIFLDNNSTTRPLPEVIDAVSAVSTASFANPGSRHCEGRVARRARGRTRANRRRAWSQAAARWSLRAAAPNRSTWRFWVSLQRRREPSCSPPVNIPPRSRPVGNCSAAAGGSVFSTSMRKGGSSKRIWTRCRGIRSSWPRSFSRTTKPAWSRTFPDWPHAAASARFLCTSTPCRQSEKCRSIFKIWMSPPCRWPRTSSMVRAESALCF